jgi:DNA-binding transcriptional MerR regulator
MMMETNRPMSATNPMSPATENTTFGISELAREFSITARAIRFYEDQGMIMPTRTGSGGRIRVYSQRDRARLKLLLRGKRLGLSLQEIKGLLDMYETPADSMVQLTRFLEVLDARRDSLRQQLADLNQLLADIDRQQADARRTLRALQVQAGVARPVEGQALSDVLGNVEAPARLAATEAGAMQNAAS